MPISYYTDINEFRLLTSNCYFASRICGELHCFYQSQNNISSIDSLKESLLSILNNLPMIPHVFLEKYYERFFYETIFDVYDAIQLTLNSGESKTLSIRDCINAYTQDIRQISSLEQEISHKKKDMFNDYQKLQYYCTNHKKLANFYAHLNIGSDDKTKSIYFTPKNQIINFLSYSNIPFSVKGFKNGVSMPNFYNLVCDFLSNHPQTVDFKNEYSAYQFHHIHYVIQYLKCYSTFLARNFNKKNIQNAYFPLLFYTRLFDTQYLSLTDYILEKYNEDLDQVYEDSCSDNLKFAFCEMQMLNSFWLPIINKSIKEILFTLLEGDLNKIQKLCQDYLTTILPHSENNYSYLSLIDKGKHEIENTTYPNPKDFTKRKEVTNSQNIKTGSPNSNFNIVFSKCFFFQDWPDYIDSCIQLKTGYCTLDSCIQFAENLFNQYKYTCSKKTILTCSEYTEYADKAFPFFQ